LEEECFQTGLEIKIFNVKETHKRTELFEGNGTIKGFKVEIHMKEGTIPIFHKPRPLPYALRDTVEKEFDRLEKSEVIEHVDRCEWASPIVVVPKADKNVRICGDYKVSVNSHIEDKWRMSLTRYQPPKIFLLNWPAKSVLLSWI
jgi:hypothetical protein